MGSVLMLKRLLFLGAAAGGSGCGTLILADGVRVVPTNIYTTPGLPASASSSRPPNRQERRPGPATGSRPAPGLQVAASVVLNSGAQRQPASTGGGGCGTAGGSGTGTPSPSSLELREGSSASAGGASIPKLPTLASRQRSQSRGSSNAGAAPAPGEGIPCAASSGGFSMGSAHAHHVPGAVASSDGRSSPSSVAESSSRTHTTSLQNQSLVHQSPSVSAELGQLDHQFLPGGADLQELRRPGTSTSGTNSGRSGGAAHAWASFISQKNLPDERATHAATAASHHHQPLAPQSALIPRPTPAAAAASFSRAAGTVARPDTSTEEHDPPQAQWQSDNSYLDSQITGTDLETGARPACVTIASDLDLLAQQVIVPEVGDTYITGASPEQGGTTPAPRHDSSRVKAIPVGGSNSDSNAGATPFPGSVPPLEISAANETALPWTIVMTPGSVPLCPMGTSRGRGAAADFGDLTQGLLSEEEDMEGSVPPGYQFEVRRREARGGVGASEAQFVHQQADARQLPHPPADLERAAEVEDPDLLPLPLDPRSWPGGAAVERTPSRREREGRRPQEQSRGTSSSLPALPRIIYGAGAGAGALPGRGSAPREPVSPPRPRAIAGGSPLFLYDGAGAEGGPDATVVPPQAPAHEQHPAFVPLPPRPQQGQQAGGTNPKPANVVPMAVAEGPSAFVGRNMSAHPAVDELLRDRDQTATPIYDPLQMSSAGIKRFSGAGSGGAHAHARQRSAASSSSMASSATLLQIMGSQAQLQQASPVTGTTITPPTGAATPAPFQLGLAATSSQGSLQPFRPSSSPTPPIDEDQLQGGSQSPATSGGPQIMMPTPCYRSYPAAQILVPQEAPPDRQEQQPTYTGTTTTASVTWPPPAPAADTAYDSRQHFLNDRPDNLHEDVNVRQYAKSSSGRFGRPVQNDARRGAGNPDDRDFWAALSLSHGQPEKEAWRDKAFAFSTPESSRGTPGSPSGGDRCHVSSRGDSRGESGERISAEHFNKRECSRGSGCAGGHGSPGSPIHVGRVGRGRSSASEVGTVVEQTGILPKRPANRGGAGLVMGTSRGTAIGAPVVASSSHPPGHETYFGFSGAGAASPSPSDRDPKLSQQLQQPIPQRTRGGGGSNDEESVERQRQRQPQFSHSDGTLKDLALRDTLPSADPRGPQRLHPLFTADRSGRPSTDLGERAGRRTSSDVDVEHPQRDCFSAPSSFPEQLQEGRERQERERVRAGKRPSRGRELHLSPEAGARAVLDEAQHFGGFWPGESSDTELSRTLQDLLLAGGVPAATMDAASMNPRNAANLAADARVRVEAELSQRIHSQTLPTPAVPSVASPPRLSSASLAAASSSELYDDRTASGAFPWHLKLGPHAPGNKNAAPFFCTSGPWGLGEPMRPASPASNCGDDEDQQRHRPALMPDSLSRSATLEVLRNAVVDTENHLHFDVSAGKHLGSRSDSRDRDDEASRNSKSSASSCAATIGDREAPLSAATSCAGSTNTDHQLYEEQYMGSTSMSTST